MKVATAFSGGLAACEFALRYEDISHEVVFACEWDKFARQQYLTFHSEPKTFYSDVSEVNATKYKESIDLFVWGSPCQDLSLAGKRKGFDGAKSSLFREGARIQSEMMPKVFIFENVKGLLSSNGGNDYKEVIKTFQDMGYLIAMKVVNTKEHGIPQNRERVFIVGFLDADQYHNFTFEDAQPLELRLRDMLEDNVDEKYYLKEQTVARFEFFNSEGNQIGKIGGEVSKHHNSITNRIFSPDNLCQTLTTASTGGNQEIKILINKIGYINQDTQGSTVYGTDGLSPSLCAGTHGYAQGYLKIGAIRGRNPENPKSRVVGEPTEQMLEINENGTANCLTSVQKDNVVVEDYRIRKLTPKECFRLQGVKDEDIILSVSDSQAYKIAGNAISVNVMQMILRQIYKPQIKIDSLF
jgi:DNA (cytosine-5)-methyltransferase 1